MAGPRSVLRCDWTPCHEMRWHTCNKKAVMMNDGRLEVPHVLITSLFSLINMLPLLGPEMESRE